MRTVLRALALIAGISLANAACGGVLQMTGRVQFTLVTTTTADGFIERVANTGSIRSGDMLFRIHATISPTFSITNSHLVVEHVTVPFSLWPGQALLNLSGRLPLNRIPDGIYYLHYALYEQQPALTCGNPLPGPCLDNFVTLGNVVRVEAGNYFAESILPPLLAVEYFHSAFGHYFITAEPTEVTAMDSGQFVGWTRTGHTFLVPPRNAAGAVNVCRFFSASFAPRSSHFYTPLASECTQVRSGRDWQFEGEVFGMRLPDPMGNCHPNTVPLFRLYNNGRSGAPNHRYTTNEAVRTEMLAQGWTSEGFGSQGIIGCVQH